MIRIVSIVSLGLLLSVSLGCAGVASPVGNGFIVTNLKGPITTGSSTAATKTGQSCASNVLGIIATGDASIDAAKKQGGIQNVSAVDHSSFSVLMVYSKFCTLVTGS